MTQAFDEWATTEREVELFLEPHDVRGKNVGICRWCGGVCAKDYPKDGDARIHRTCSTRCRKLYTAMLAGELSRQARTMEYLLKHRPALAREMGIAQEDLTVLLPKWAIETDRKLAKRLKQARTMHRKVKDPKVAVCGLQKTNGLRGGVEGILHVSGPTTSATLISALAEAA